MANLATKVVTIAQAEIGYLEKKTNVQLDDKTANAGYNNWNKYARDMDNIPEFFNGSKNGYHWCAVFTCWCLMKAFGTAEAMRMLFLPKDSAGASCTYLASRFRAKGRLYNDAIVGDFALFTNDGGKTFFHVGIVTGVDKNWVYTVEGNTSGGSGVVANGGGVFAKKYRRGYNKLRFGRPLYDAVEQENNPVGSSDVTYCAYAANKWWPKVVNYNHEDSNGYAGVRGRAIQGLRVMCDDRDVYYRVHTVNGTWLSAIKNMDGVGPNSYAGIYGKNIDGVQMRTSKGKIKYRVHLVDGSWLPWVISGQEFLEPTGNGYAGLLGRAIDQIQIGIEE